MTTVEAVRVKLHSEKWMKEEEWPKRGLTRVKLFPEAHKQGPDDTSSPPQPPRL